MAALSAPPPIAVRPGLPKNRAEVEPPTSNLTLYGETPAPLLSAEGRAPLSHSLQRGGGSGSVAGSAGRAQDASVLRTNMTTFATEQTTSSVPTRTAMLPASYATGDWQSVTHAQFKPLPYVAISKDLQNERAVFQRMSELPLNEASIKVFDPPVGFAGRETQTKTDFKPLGREWYVNRPAVFAIGGGGVKAVGAAGDVGATRPPIVAQHSGANPFSGQSTHSDVQLKMTNGHDAHAYETLTRRQFQPYPIDESANGTDKARRWENKKDMVASHFVIGADRTVYATASQVPLPSEKPLVKNQIISRAPADNPHVATSAKDARPTGLTLSEIAHRKTHSSVPVLTRNNPEYNQYGGAWPATSTSYATPAWRADRQPSWQLFGNGVGGVRLGHEDAGSNGANGQSSTARSSSSLGLPSASAAPAHGRRSATPSLGVGASNSSARGGSGSNGAAEGVGRPPSASAANNSSLRWVSASKSSYKGFQYQ